MNNQHHDLQRRKSTSAIPPLRLSEALPNIDEAAAQPKVAFDIIISLRIIMSSIIVAVIITISISIRT